MAAWLALLPTWAKAAGGIVVLLGVLVAGSRVVVTYNDLPERVTQVETMRSEYDSVHVVQQHALEHIDEQVGDIKCLLLKEAQGEDPLGCLLEED